MENCVQIFFTFNSKVFPLRSIIEISFSKELFFSFKKVPISPQQIETARTFLWVLYITFKMKLKGHKISQKGCLIHGAW